MRSGGRLVTTGAALAILSAAIGACGSETVEEQRGNDAPPEDIATYEQAGPHSVEQFEVSVAGPDGPDDVRVWVPTGGNEAGESGPWPLLVLGGMSQGTGYAATSASAGDDVAGALLVSGGGALTAGGTATVPTLILGGGPHRGGHRLSGSRRHRAGRPRRQLTRASALPRDSA